MSTMPRAEFLQRFKQLVVTRWEAHESASEREEGANYSPARREAVLAMIRAATTVGEIIRTMDTQRHWGRVAIMHLLVEAAVDRLLPDEFTAILYPSRYDIPDTDDRDPKAGPPSGTSPG
jgi:hypothetical protein